MTRKRSETPTKMRESSSSSSGESLVGLVRRFHNGGVKVKLELILIWFSHVRLRVSSVTREGRELSKHASVPSHLTTVQETLLTDWPS